TGNTYVLDGLIFVDAGATLTIDAGTVVKGRAANEISTGDFASALIVKRGSNIEANGTADAPIIFTAERDDVSNPDDVAANERGLWGGLIVLGAAPTNTGVTDNPVEGIPEAENAVYGGTDEDDDSGTIRYISIRHGGADIGADNEINGLTLGGVGSGTTIEYVEVLANQDDGIEWFGGTVDVKYALVAYSGDDSFDYAQGWRGNGQFWMVIQSPDDSDSAGEFDNLPENFAATPLTTPTVSNGTFIGPGENGFSTGSRILRFRDGAGGSFYNSVFDAGGSRAITFASDETLALLGTDDLTIANNVFGLGFGAGTTFADIIGGVRPSELTALSASNFLQETGIEVTTEDTDNDTFNDNLVSVTVDRTDVANTNGATFDFADDDGGFFSQVGYIGAINPNANRQWFTDWTFVDQIGVLEVEGTIDNAEIIVTDDIVGDATWTANNTYILDGLVFVDAGATLTIEAGTVVKGRAANDISNADFASALIVKRGSNIEANGTADAPIIFTAERDDLSTLDDIAPNERGLWGGVIILGSAPTNTGVTNNAIEGIPEAENAVYGGSNAGDDSGTFRYVSIRHGGAVIGADNEINGLTLGGVGSGTEIEYVEVFANTDDGIEWFGGTVDVKYAVVAYSGDDSFDYAQGWDGNGQFWLVVQSPDDSDSAGEFDNLPENFAATPLTSPVVSNGTFVGAGLDGFSTGSRLLRFRDGAGGSFYNSVFASGPRRAITFESDETLALIGTDDLDIRNNVFGLDFGDGDTFAAVVTGGSAAQTVALEQANFLQDAGISVTTEDTDGDTFNDNLVAVTVARGTVAGFPDADFSASNLDSDFFDDVDYIGAFDPGSERQFFTGWTLLDGLDILAIEGGVSNVADPAESVLALTAFPNPTSGDATVRFSLDRAQDVRVALYDVLGRQVAVVAEGTFGTGESTVVVATSELPSGVYVVRLEGEGVAATQQLSVVR
ncbi:T9SS type A sorting domain-containing protein, partial [Rubrivirga sp.]|uniref:T9SS type A sorting domain-containing protein n=1 Tax=Rubrivirga sp. TaxID=1885344 RepID=UPI003C772E42